MKKKSLLPRVMPNAPAASAVQRKAAQQTAPVNKKGPIAPPAYRPQTAPQAAQLKTANVALQRKPPVAPPVYRPERPRIVQPKTASSPPAAHVRVIAQSTSQVAKLKAVARDTSAKPPSSRLDAPVIQREIRSRQVTLTRFYTSLNERKDFETREEAARYERESIVGPFEYQAYNRSWGEIKKVYKDSYGMDIEEYANDFFAAEAKARAFRAEQRADEERRERRRAKELKKS